MWNNPLSSNFIVVHFHCHPRHSPARQFLRRTWRAACCFPISDIGAVLETKHLPRCFEDRCLREPSSEYIEEGELRVRQCLLRCVARDSVSQALSSTQPKRGGGYGCSPPARAGNLLSRLFTGETQTVYPIPPQASSGDFGN